MRWDSTIMLTKSDRNSACGDSLSQNLKEVLSCMPCEPWVGFGFAIRKLPGGGRRSYLNSSGADYSIIGSKPLLSFEVDGSLEGVCAPDPSDRLKPKCSLLTAVDTKGVHDVHSEKAHHFPITYIQPFVPRFLQPAGI